jgi:tRNA pseudouridine38-40 synthase
LSSETILPPPRILAGLNAFLPDDIRVSAVQIMPREFHAIQDAQGKTYRYQIQSGPVRHVLGRHAWWYVPPALDVAAMQQGALRLVGTHDFAAFQTMGSPRRSTVRTIRDLTVEASQTGPYQWLRIFVTADGFLYNMVRCIAGTLAEVGKGRQPAEWVTEVLKGQRREQAGATAPPHGLCLMQVDYPPEFM